MPDYRILQEWYTPPSLPARDKEIEEIQQQIDLFLKNSMCNNLLLDGVSGSGKTVTLKYLRERFSDAIFYTNAQRAQNSLLTVLNEISDETAHSYHRALHNTVAYLHKQRRILIIDEIDKITNQQKLWHCLNEIYRETDNPMIIVTNKKQFVNTLPYDARNTLLFSNILFPAYNAEELVQIALQRIKLCDYNFKDNEKVTHMIAKVSYDYGARMAIRLLRNLILNDIKDPSFEAIQKAKEEIDGELTADTIKRMTNTEKEVLCLIADIIHNEKKTYLTTGFLIDALPNLSRVWISQIINSLEDYDYITTEKMPLRGRGRTRRIMMDRGLASYLCELKE